ncbi:hypothetical protein Moror_2870 [Moniliophthora roreri MCA 2997]|uniref:Uncharacterized protein n=2 Tax=Moniliophthora roreri TaxID=221103 RepID=V2XEJ1_MONRO|nr:hypothetical protein Moror_2870 [Moniliophthora roreri MCA 2997]
MDTVDAMRDAFDTLAASHRQNGNITLTVSALDQLAQSYNVICGKWMMFCNTAEVDAFWDAVVRLICLERGKGSAKVSPNKGDNQHVICVYVEDFADWGEVMGVRDALRTIGVTYPIGFKMDAYTLLGIYRRNKWGINCNRYYE